MANQLRCEIAWETPVLWSKLHGMPFETGSCVYAILIGQDTPQSLLRIGATNNLVERIKSYRIVSYIPDAYLTYHFISDDFRNDLKPVLHRYYSSADTPRAKIFKGKSPEYCVQRELFKVEYRVESLLLDEYKRRHGHYPSGNAKPGSKRRYLQNDCVVEVGAVSVLPMPAAQLATVQLGHTELQSLL